MQFLFSCNETKAEKRKKSILISLLVLFMLFATDSILVNTNNDRFFARVSWILMIVLFLLLAFFSINSHKRIPTKMVVILGLMSLAIFCTMAFSNKAINVNYFQRILLLWVSALIVVCFSYQPVMRSYLFIIKLISLLSLFTWALSMIGFNFSFLPKIYTGNLSFGNLILTCVPDFSKRNYGIFWEPGAFQLYLNFAIFYEIRHLKKIRPFDIMLFSITIFTTYSTTGYLLLALNFVFLFLFKTQKENRIRLGFIIALGVALLVVLFVNDGLFDKVFSKIIAFSENENVKNSSTVSTYNRFYANFASIEIILENPLFGAGIDGVKTRSFELYEITSNTNTILSSGATFGILYMVLFLYFIFNAAKKNQSTVPSIFSLALLVLMFFTENMLVSFPFHVFIFYESCLFIHKNSAFPQGFFRHADLNKRTWLSREQPTSFAMLSHVP